MAGDLYLRSVCFSPDGKLLATGAEDKQIRVSTTGNSGNPAFLISSTSPRFSVSRAVFTDMGYCEQKDPSSF